MARAYLIIIVMLGAFSAMISGGSPGSGGPASLERARTASLGGTDESAVAAEPSAEDGTIELKRDDDGHFYADVEINGATVHALVDTGASIIALSREDARSAGLAASLSMPGVIGEGADGEVHGEQVTLERVALGHKTAEGMQAVVLNAGEQTLLGQSFLSKFASVEIRGDTMVLR